MAGTTDTSGYPGQPPGNNSRGEDDGSDHENQSPHPSCNNSPRRSTGGGSGGPPDDGNDGGNGDGDPPTDPPPDSNDPNNIADDIHCELRSLLSSGRDSSSKVQAPDPFDWSDPDKLKSYSLGQKKFGYTLTFLKGTALEFFEPYILVEDDPGYVEPTFFTDWIAFKQILLDNFSSTFPKEAEMALEKLTFPDCGQATKYFIQFAKYKAWTNFGNCAYHCIAYHTLPKHLKDRITNIIPRPDSYEDL
ncbi:hypothetical protein M422DRAFT_274296 [Sphaerobolus stellatus SS14]|uniref:Retrotransposon gag domain-containing protein n=1 Tax=Sphaerobolus stellatus (strain SS14) TaxID=990650 RepID=A0A0C9T786_SPHS4|nr:hypothetical protein M422DRAFT_274296 [Sphaerobolus stellatus SS14]